MNANESTTLLLLPGNVLTVTAPAGSTGSVVRLARIPGGGNSQSTTAIAGANLTFGPYADTERFQVNVTAGTVTQAQAPYSPSDDATDEELAAILVALITSGDTTHAPTVKAVFDALALKAPLDSPSFTGAVVIGETVQIPEKTPVNAVAASKLLTIGTAPAEGDTVSIGGVAYKFRAAIGAGAAASKVLTSDNTEVADGDTITIGTTVYRFKDTPAQAYDVQRDGTTADTTMGYLIAAINASGTEGVEYFAGTLIHPSASAGTLAAHAFTVTANDIGFAGNDIALASTAAHVTWAGAATFLSGGVDAEAANDVLIGTVEESIDNLVLAVTYDAGAGTSEGTAYGTGTVANPLATAVKASASTMTATNLVKGAIGNSTALAETLADGSWAGAATFLTGGIDGTVGLANETCADGSYLYHCTAANTIADTNWRRVSLGTVY